MNTKERLYLIRQASRVNEIGEISDGFHTFNSLYNQRMYLWAALVKAYKDKAWKSKKHNDGKLCFGGGWFIVGITTPAGDYTYHYELEYWGLFDCKVLDKAPEFDGHTDKDVTRVMTLKPCYTSQWIPVEKTNNTINVFFRKEQDGWHTYTQYGIDLPTNTTIEFGEHIAKAVNLLNGKGATNE